VSATEAVGRIGGAAARVTWDGAVITAVTPLDADPAGLPVLAPGLVDLQVNGYDGLDVNAADVDPDTIAELTHRLAAAGVTTWLPTIITAPEERIVAALRCIAAARAADPLVAAAIPSCTWKGRSSPTDRAREGCTTPRRCARSIPPRWPGGSGPGPSGS
jgi:N-acetylglucosamine-6-phosphate deacetylase